MARKAETRLVGPAGSQTADGKRAQKPGAGATRERARNESREQGDRLLRLGDALGGGRRAGRELRRSGCTWGRLVLLLHPKLRVGLEIHWAKTLCHLEDPKHTAGREGGRAGLGPRGPPPPSRNLRIQEGSRDVRGGRGGPFHGI